MEDYQKEYTKLLKEHKLLLKDTCKQLKKDNKALNEDYKNTLKLIYGKTCCIVCGYSVLEKYSSEYGFEMPYKDLKEYADYILDSSQKLIDENFEQYYKKVNRSMTKKSGVLKTRKKGDL